MPIAAQNNRLDRMPLLDLDYTLSLWKQAVDSRNFSDAEVYLNNYLLAVKEYINNDMLLMPEVERNGVLEALNIELQLIIDLCLDFHTEYSSLGTLVYDSTLLIKSLSVNFSRQIDMAISEYDERIQVLWNDLKNIKKTIETLKQFLEWTDALQGIMHGNDTLSVIFENNLMENPELTKAQEEHLRLKAMADDPWIYESEKEFLEWIDLDSDILSGLFIDTNFLLQQLTPEEVAIEIIISKEPLPTRGEFKNKYYALILHPKLDVPQIVALCDNISGNSLFYDSHYSPKEIYSALWSPILKKIPANTSVFYVAQGSNILPVTEVGKIIGLPPGEEFRIHSLLSTKDILRVKNKKSDLPETKKALVIGGVDYWFASDSLYMNSIFPYISQTEKNEIMDSLIFRGQGFDYLPGSALEVSSIADRMQSYSWDITLLDGEHGTEKQLNSYLSQNIPTVIHISTHGFYFPESAEVKDLSIFNKYPLHEFTARKSKNPLLRSGFVCSGGNLAWNGMLQNSEYEDGDGLVTALRISRMNLTGTELVVLSICESGLGEQKYNDSAYGLVHGFRLAGVDTMIITLCKIPDDDIVDFMEVFYSKWLSGINIRDAFNFAEKSMLDKYPDEPQKWAAFMLIE